jgi:hypothetical protein
MIDTVSASRLVSTKTGEAQGPLRGALLSTNLIPPERAAQAMEIIIVVQSTSWSRSSRRSFIDGIRVLEGISRQGDILLL